jgi:transposase
MTIKQFLALFPDDTACLDHLFKVRFGVEPACPKCGEIGKFRKLARLPAYTCNCGYHIHPMVGTPFAKSRTPLQKWFYAMFLFTTTRNGVAAKEIQRQLGVTYKCAWRMAAEIRKYMGYVDGDAPLGGKGGGAVEIDKAFIGGKDKLGEDDKSIVLGMVERGGEIVTRVIPARSEWYVVPQIVENVKSGSQIMTDEARAFRNLGAVGFKHESVNHSAKEYVNGMGSHQHD